MNKVLFSSVRDDWETPTNLFIELDNEFHFTLDVCASSKNAKCKRYYTKEDSLFSHTPVNESIFMNPPYSKNMGKYIKWAYDNYQKNKVIVLLIPSRTDTKWFHEYIYNHCEIRFIKGRLKFELNGIAYNSSTFPSMICIYRKEN